MIARAFPDPAPLVGRERELAMLRDALAATLAGRGSLVLIGGKAGIGKTTLAETLLAEAGARGAQVLVGRCYDLAETPPYGPWRELFDRLPHDDALPTLPQAVLLPEREGEALSGQDAIMRRVQRYVAALAAQAPLIVLLDDLHWADPASLDLLRVIARGLPDLPLLILAAYRADEIVPGHPLGNVLAVLVRESRAARLDLRPLDGDAIGALVAMRYALGAAEREQLVRYLAERSEGNALFLGELLHTLEGEGLLRRVPDGWHLGDLTSVPMPPLLRQVIAGRAARLPAEAGRLLTVAATIGQEVPLALWAAVAETAEDGLLMHAERAIEAHLLAETPDGVGVRFAHALVREALYEGVSALRRRGLHRRTAEALLAAQAQPDPDAVAYHLQQAGDPRAVTWLIAAGERAQRVFAWLTAAARYEAALEALRGEEGRAGERGWLLLRLVQVRALGDARQNLAALDETARLAEGAADPALAAAALFARGVIHASLRDRDLGRALMEAGVAAVEALPPTERVRLNRLETLGSTTSPINRYLGTLVVRRSFSGPFPEVAALGERFVAQTSTRPEQERLERGTASALGDGYAGLAIARAILGRPDEAHRAFTAARAAASLVGDPFALGGLAELELRLHALPYAPERLATRRHLAAEVEAHFGRAADMAAITPRLYTLPLLVLEGAWGEARTLATAGLSEGATVAARTWVLTWLGILAREQGERELAQAQVRAALPDGAATDPDDLGIDGPPLLRLAAALAVDVADFAAARDWLATHDGWLDRNGAVLWRAEGQLTWAHYHRAVGEHAEAWCAAERALAHATAPRQPLALLAAHRTLAELGIVAGGHAVAQAHLTEALALAEACAAPYERALTLLALAELRAAEGKAEDAAAALAEARATLSPLEAAPAQARAAALAAALAAPSPVAPPAESYPFGLTAREAEVLALLAAGLTDRQIGDRLFVSRNTVAFHTKSIYGKLGVSTRAAAARLAAERGLA